MRIARTGGLKGIGVIETNPVRIRRRSWQEDELARSSDADSRDEKWRINRANE
jgi:hypothetical protein